MSRSHKHAQHFLQDKEANLLLVTLSAAKGLIWDAHGVSIRKWTCRLSPPPRRSRSPEPFASLKGKLREGERSGDSGAEILRCAQDDSHK
jgi:hypothetical protein